MMNKPTNQMSTFSEHGSLRMISGAIQATVPAKLIFVLISFHSRHVPKSLILTISFWPINTLQCNRMPSNATLLSIEMITLYNGTRSAALTWDF